MWKKTMSSPSEKQVRVRVSLRIETDATVPVKLVQVAVDPDEKDTIVVVATNFEESAMGAVAVSGLLRMASDALVSELADTAQAGPPEDKPRRFNPQPRMGSANKKEQ